MGEESGEGISSSAAACVSGGQGTGKSHCGDSQHPCQHRWLELGSPHRSPGKAAFNRCVVRIASCECCGGWWSEEIQLPQTGTHCGASVPGNWRVGVTSGIGHRHAAARVAGCQAGCVGCDVAMLCSVRTCWLCRVGTEGRVALEDGRPHHSRHPLSNTSYITRTSPAVLTTTQRSDRLETSTVVALRLATLRRVLLDSLY